MKEPLRESMKSRLADSISQRLNDLLYTHLVEEAWKNQIKPSIVSTTKLGKKIMKKTM